MKLGRKLLIILMGSFMGHIYGIVETTRAYGPEVPTRSVLVVIYMAARNDLSIYAETHLKQLLNLGSSDRVKLFVHLDLQKPGDPLVTKNYFIEKDQLIPVGSQSPKDSGKKETLIEATTLAYELFPADEVVLVLWNHGTGPIEPKVVPSLRNWDLWSYDEKSGSIRLDESIGYIDRLSPGDGSFVQPKGICFDDVTGNYLTTTDLTQAITYLSKEILQRKFSIVACDACLMAGADIFIELKDSVDYFVASQEVELSLGYKYDDIVEPLVKDRICCGEELACHFVQSFKNYYSPQIEFYTHVAIDLSYGSKLNENIDAVARCLSYGLTYQQDKSVREAIRLSRHKKHCICFNEPSYIDLGNFYRNLLEHLPQCTLSKEVNAQDYHSLLYTLLHEGLTLIQESVKANVAGSKHNLASGISIYFPEFIIHNSYHNNPFAQKNSWLTFLKDYTDGKY